MSKYVKNLIADHLRDRLRGVNEALLVDVIGLNAVANDKLRSELRGKNIQVLVVKNSLAQRAAEGTPLSPMFAGLTGTSAVCWGGEDIAALAKEIARLVKDEKYKPFTLRGGVLDGQRLSEQQVVEVGKWPSRSEQLSILAAQILSPGGTLCGQLTAMGGALASQVEEAGKRKGPDSGSADSPTEEIPSPGLGDAAAVAAPAGDAPAAQE